MERMTPQIITELAAQRGARRITFYLPIDRSHARVQSSQLRFRNLLREAEERLVEGGLEVDAASEELAPARDLLETGRLWETPADGVAVFCAEATARAFVLPLVPPEEVTVGERFHLRPLLAMLGEEQRFHVLALSKNLVRLLECDAWSARPLIIPAMPTSLVEALGKEIQPRDLQLHTASRAASRQVAVFHGRGSANEDAKTELPRFLQRVDAAICAVPRLLNEPLVLAGVGYLVADYHAISHHPRIVAEAVLGNADEVPDEELRRRAWKIVRSALRVRESRAAGMVRELAGSPRGCFDLDHALRAAREGRIEALFLAEDAEAWGRVDAAGDIELHPAHRAGDEDLLDLTAALTIVQGGEVYDVPAAEVPSDGPLAAVLRY